MLLLADKCISTLIKWARAWAWARTSIVSKFTHIQRKTLFSYQLLHTIWKRNSNADTSMNVSMSICIKQWWKLTRVGREIFCLFIRLFGEWRNSMRKRDTRFMFKKKKQWIAECSEAEELFPVGFAFLLFGFMFSVLATLATFNVNPSHTQSHSRACIITCLLNSRDTADHFLRLVEVFYFGAA